MVGNGVHMCSNDPTTTLWGLPCLVMEKLDKNCVLGVTGGECMSQKHVKIDQKSVAIPSQAPSTPQSDYFIVYNTHSRMSSDFGDVSLCFGRVRSF